MNVYTFVILIILLGVSVPISAIVLDSALGKALAKLIEQKVNKEKRQLDDEVKRELELQREKIQQLEEANNRLEEKYNFLERLLESPDKKNSV